MSSWNKLANFSSMIVPFHGQWLQFGVASLINRKFSERAIKSVSSRQCEDFRMFFHLFGAAEPPHYVTCPCPEDLQAAGGTHRGVLQHSISTEMDWQFGSAGI